jgi:hypothetical protein
MSETNDQRIYDRCIIRVGQLEAENAKLRDLVRGLWYCTENENKALCEGCPLGVVEGDRLALACEKLMHELGI